MWKKYGVDGIPHFFIIDQEGKISDYWRGYQKGTVETITEDLDGGVVQ
ncbi:hypothetical protein R9C00_03780 [Flammeovirgaceae bacterium SG7u.111]|nr:hypothetical protein [Flammeovirgaceae bacterium SG7u.132]WPO36565.1 hypothetical protein R9C00_03780 [Flammeovirgaceae bacterium SG7u.111]